MTETHDIILKTDRRGRLRFQPEQRAALLAAYDSSGLSGPKFAQLHGVNYQTFAGWLQRRKRATSPALAPAARLHKAKPSGLFTLIEAVTAGAESGLSSVAPLEVHLPGGARLMLSNSSQLALAAALIRQLHVAPQPC